MLALILLLVVMNKYIMLHVTSLQLLLPKRVSSFLLDSVLSRLSKEDPSQNMRNSG
jgi:hypothetical protein